MCKHLTHFANFMLPPFIAILFIEKKMSTDDYNHTVTLLLIVF